jgi:hypothetical protein
MPWYAFQAHVRGALLKMWQRLRDTSTLLCVTAAQDGKVSDARTRCHIDVEGSTRDTLP